MGYKNVYLKGTNFCGVQRVEMGYCTSKWGTDGNPDQGPYQAIIVSSLKFYFRNSFSNQLISFV